MSMSVAECEYKGGHRYDGVPFRLPVRFQMPIDPYGPRDYTQPQPMRYWEVYNCTRCGLEKKIARGFDPSTLPDNSGAKHE